MKEKSRNTEKVTLTRVKPTDYVCSERGDFKQRLEPHSYIWLSEVIMYANGH